MLYKTEHTPAASAYTESVPEKRDKKPARPPSNAKASGVEAKLPPK